MHASEPQTDRELLLTLNTKIEGLSDAIDRFSVTLKDIEEKKMGKLENRIDELENWQQQVNGGWKSFGILTAILSALALILSFLK